MREILEELNQTAGIRGSMVMTHDGMVAASDLGLDLEEEVVAALASSLLIAVTKSLQDFSPDDSLTQYVLASSDGSFGFAPGRAKGERSIGGPVSGSVSMPKSPESSSGISSVDEFSVRSSVPASSSAGTFETCFPGRVFRFG